MKKLKCYTCDSEIMIADTSKGGWCWRCVLAGKIEVMEHTRAR